MEGTVGIPCNDHDLTVPKSSATSDCLPQGNTTSACSFARDSSIELSPTPRRSPRKNTAGRRSNDHDALMESSALLKPPSMQKTPRGRLIDQDSSVEPPATIERSSLNSTAGIRHKPSTHFQSTTGTVNSMYLLSASCFFCMLC
jgi:hypothetical protein